MTERAIQRETCFAVPVSAVPAVHAEENTSGNLTARRNAFWEGALESASILAWIVAYLAKPDSPCP